jgi:hypothetical protein
VVVAMWTWLPPLPAVAALQGRVRTLLARIRP